MHLIDAFIAQITRHRARKTKRTRRIVKRFCSSPSSLSSSCSTRRGTFSTCTRRRVSTASKRTSSTAAADFHYISFLSAPCPKCFSPSTRRWTFSSTASCRRRSGWSWSAFWAGGSRRCCTRAIRRRPLRWRRRWQQRPRQILEEIWLELTCELKTTFFVLCYESLFILCLSKKKSKEEIYNLSFKIPFLLCCDGPKEKWTKWRKIRWRKKTEMHFISHTYFLHKNQLSLVHLRLFNGKEKRWLFIRRSWEKGGYYALKTFFDPLKEASFSLILHC